MDQRKGVGSSAMELVKLNVGGHRFMTTRTTLTRPGGGENFFTALLSGRVPVLKDDQDHYFIDRDGQYFSILLEFLRTGDLIVPSHISRDAVLREAAFYLIEIEPSRSAAQPRVDGVYTRHHYIRRENSVYTTTEFLIFLPTQELLSGLHGLRHFGYAIDQHSLITYSVDNKLESFCFESVRPTFRAFSSPRGRVFITDKPMHICTLRAPGGASVERHLVRLYFHDHGTIFVVMQPDLESDFQELKHSYVQSQQGPYPLYTFEVSYEQQSYSFICIVTARELWLRYKGMPVWNSFREISFDRQDIPR